MFYYKFFENRWTILYYVIAFNSGSIFQLIRIIKGSNCLIISVLLQLCITTYYCWRSNYLIRCTNSSCTFFFFITGNSKNERTNEWTYKWTQFYIKIVTHIHSSGTQYGLKIIIMIIIIMILIVLSSGGHSSLLWWWSPFKNLSVVQTYRRGAPAKSAEKKILLFEIYFKGEYIF